MSAHDELAAEQAHLASSREQLTRMRERTASMDSSAAGDWVSREFLESTFALRMRQLADDPTIPLFFGRLDMVSTGSTSEGARRSTTRGRALDRRGFGRDVPHRAPPHLGSRGQPDGDRLAGPGEPAVLPGQQGRADGGRAPATVRLPARPAHRVRGRGPRVGPGAGLLRDPRGGDRAAARRPHARHRRHHPAGAGRDRALRADPLGLRAGRPGDRQDGRRPAPGGVPPLRAPRPAHPPGRAGGRTERELPALHPRRPARARRDRRDAVHDRGAGLDRLDPRARAADPRVRLAGARRGQRRGRDAQGRRPAGRGAAPGALVARADADGGSRRPAGRAAVAGRGVRGRGARRLAARRAGCGTAPRARWCRSPSRTGSW